MSKSFEEIKNQYVIMNSKRVKKFRIIYVVFSLLIFVDFFYLAGNIIYYVA